MGGQQWRPLGLALQKFFCGCEGLVVVVVAVDSPGLLAPSTLPFPFALTPHLPPPLPLLFLPSLALSIQAFFTLVAPVPADDMACFLVGKHLQPLHMVEVVEWVPGILMLGGCWYVVVACSEDGGWWW